MRDLENWLEGIVRVLRVPLGIVECRNYVLPLVFLKRVSDVFEDGRVGFHVPEGARWESIKRQNGNLGEYLNNALRELTQENPELEGVIDRVDFRVVDEYRLREVINRLDQRRLGFYDVEPDIMGRVYEFLLRETSGGSWRNLGEFYTPEEVADVLVRLLDPEPGMEVYDPSCGSGRLLIKCYQYFKEKYEQSAVPPLHLYGQEISHTAYAIAKMNVVMYGIQNAHIKLGDTLQDPAFKEEDGSLKKFDLVIANPPWNQRGYTEEFYRSDPYKRFEFGVPPKESADWGWLQHIYASLKDNGRAAVVFDAGSVSRNNIREKEIRKRFVEDDIISAVILLPENLFYNTTAPSVIIVIDKDKKAKGEVLLIDASQFYQREGRKNRLTKEGIEKIVEVYRKWVGQRSFTKTNTHKAEADASS